MKLIIAGSRTFTDYQFLSHVLSSHKHLVSEVLHGGARGADRLGFRWPCGITCVRAASPQTGSALGKALVCAAITRWRRQEICWWRSTSITAQALRT